MAPQCEHCLNVFDSDEFIGFNGSKIECPHCGKEMTIRYSFWESLRDPKAWFTLDPTCQAKYVSPWRIALVVGLVVLCLAIVFWIKWD